MKKKNRRKSTAKLSIFTVIMLMTALYLLAEFSDNILAWYGMLWFVALIIVIVLIFYIIFKFGHRSI